MSNRRIWILVISLLMLTAAFAISSTGCGVGAIVYDCNYPLVGRLAHDGQHDACCHIDLCPCHCLNDPCPDLAPIEEALCNLPSDAGTDAAIPDGGTDAASPDGGTSSCDGTCVLTPPFELWEGPGLLWLGPEGAAPACPDDAPTVAYQGHEGLNVPPATCGACGCSASSGGCAPPLALTTSSKPCGDGSGMITPFDGPLAWNGLCTTNDCISPDPACAHPVAIQSLAATPLVLGEQGCTPSLVIAQDSNPPTWTTEVLACRGPISSGHECSDHRKSCVSFVAPPEFATCIFTHSDVSCPDTYPEKHLVFAGFDDQRACTACACSAPVGSSCTAALSVFQDNACSVPLLAGPLSSSGPSCFDLMPAGLPLGSKTVTDLAYLPGACVPSGGEASGTVEPSDPATFCCLAS